MGGQRQVAKPALQVHCAQRVAAAPGHFRGCGSWEMFRFNYAAALELVNEPPDPGAPCDRLNRVSWRFGSGTLTSAEEITRDEEWQGFRRVHVRTHLFRSRPKFKLFKNVAHLDAAKLSKGSHTIELGKFEGRHCDCVVMAKVSGGMITGVIYPKCEKATKTPPKLAQKLQAAHKELRKAADVKWEDIPVQEFARSAAARAKIVVVITTSGDCFEVCIGHGPGTNVCWICCPGWCIGPSDPQIAFS